MSSRPSANEGDSVRYTVEATLGRGGMGTVYRVRDQRHGHSVALKRVTAKDEVGAAKRRSQLEREYHTLQQLRHPRIIEVYDYGIDEIGAFYTMELLDGADLDAGGKLPWRQACALLFDVSSSLAIVHSRGLVHRDVSARNVRRTADGRAKLLDFGAMMCMGVAKEIVGTPPFMPPEALALQALDARADLFSLGALAYYLLTGRHAFPARKFAALRDAWRSRPMPPGRVVADLPPALDALVLQLLALDRSARPQSAAEVMERLCAIAELPLEERSDVSRAYLTTPNLVGRDPALVAIRTRMLSLVRGDGGVVLVTGEPGSGRSRMLDACAVEAKLLGATVVRADAGDGAGGDWGVAGVLASQLRQALPGEVEQAARLSRDVLGHVIDELGPVEGESQSVSVPERSLILRHMRDFMLALAHRRRLVLVVDDADEIDEPSAALLAALAHKSHRHSLMVVVAIKNDKHEEPAVHLLCSLASAVELRPLDLEQTGALLRSLFGDIPSLGFCAGRIHKLANGMPGAIMELAQHLVRIGLARYEAGSWLLPSRLADDDLPLTTDAALRARIAALGSDARELAEIMSVADARLGLDGCAELTDHGDQRRVYYALDELVAARIQVTDGDSYRFSQHGFAAALLEGMTAARRASLHDRIARLLATRGADVVLRAHHLIEAARKDEAIRLLCSIDLSVRLPPLPLLESALAHAERTGHSATVVYRLSMAVIMKASLVTAGDSFRRCVPAVLGRLEQESGLVRYRDLSQLPPDQRLLQALTEASERYARTPEKDRVFAPSDAIRELGRLSAAFCSMVVTTFDLALLDQLPSLAPFLPLSPAMQVLAQLIEGVRSWIQGREMPAKQLFERVLERIGHPDRGGLEDMQHSRMFLGLQYLLGLIDATAGSEAAEERARLLERDRSMRVAAWRVRMLLQFNRGNVDAARKCQRRAELLQIHDGGEARYPGSTTAGFELHAYSNASDLLGVKGTLDALTALAQQYPGWKPLLLFAQIRYRALQGDAAGALELVPAGFELAPAGRHFAFPYFAAAHVTLLADLGRLEEAVRHSWQYLAICDREQLVGRKMLLQRDFAPVLARAGHHREAVELSDAAIAFSESWSTGGLALGIFYEKRAEVAMYMGDREQFLRAFERCAIEYKKGQNPTLSAKLARLLDRARAVGCEPGEPARELVAALVPHEHESAHDTVRGRLLECTAPEERARCALTILLQSAESCAGYLYGVRDSQVVALCALPEPSSDAALALWVQQQLIAEVAASGEDTDESSGPTPSPPVAPQYTDADGRRFRAIPLVGEHEAQQRIAAILVLQATGNEHRPPPRYMLFEIANRLLEHGDVTGALLAVTTITQQT